MDFIDQFFLPLLALFTAISNIAAKWEVYQNLCFFEPPCALWSNYGFLHISSIYRNKVKIYKFERSEKRCELYFDVTTVYQKVTKSMRFVTYQKL